MLRGERTLLLRLDDTHPLRKALVGLNAGHSDDPWSERYSLVSATDLGRTGENRPGVDGPPTELGQQS